MDVVHRSSLKKALAMEVHILDRNVGITPRQRDHIDRCLLFAFHRFSSHVRSIDVWLTDVNGPKGGDDLQCRIKVVLDEKGELVVEGKGVSVEQVASESIDRAAIAVSRRLDRLNDAQGISLSGQ